ncbi:hypothetical protein D3C85_1651870 [compost metagenome]
MVIEPDLAAFRFAEAPRTTQQAGLAAAVGADQTDELTGGHVKRGIPQPELVMTVTVAQGGPGEVCEVQRGHAFTLKYSV